MNINTDRENNQPRSDTRETAEEKSARSVKTERSSRSDSDASGPEVFRGSMAKPVKNRTPTRPNHNQATAKIYIEGLAIMCFNVETQSTEIVFVKEHHSPVEIRVFNRHCGNPIYSYSAPADEQVRIDIRKMSAQHNGDLYYEDNNGNDDDSLWIPDMCEWYNRPAMTFFPDAKQHLSAKLVTQDAVYYTRKKSKIDAMLLNWPSTWKRKVGRIVGANIVCGPNDQGISIETTDDGLQPFRKEDGPFYILVRTGTHELEMDHMQIVYDHIIDLPVAERRYSLKFVAKEKRLVYNCARDDFDEVTKDEKEHASDTNARVSLVATEYACQPHGGGNGDPPDIP